MSNQNKSSAKIHYLFHGLALLIIALGVVGYFRGIIEVNLFAPLSGVTTVFVEDVDSIIVGVNVAEVRELEPLAGTKNLFPEEKVLVFFYDEDGSDWEELIDAMRTGQAIVIHVEEVLNDLGLENLGYRDKTIYKLTRAHYAG